MCDSEKDILCKFERKGLGVKGMSTLNNCYLHFQSLEYLSTMLYSSFNLKSTLWKVDEIKELLGLCTENRIVKRMNFSKVWTRRIAEL